MVLASSFNLSISGKNLTVSQLILLFKLICSILIAWLLYISINEILKPSLVTPLSAASSNSEDLHSSSYTPADYQFIVTRNILGDLNPTTLPITKPVGSPPTQLPFELIGTVLSKEGSFAIIENKKKAEQDSFSIGDIIFEIATLKTIAVDRIEIERNGAIEQIVIADLLDAANSGEKAGGITTLEGDQFVVEEAELDTALSNMPLLLSQARAIPYFQDGKSVGLRLFAIRNGSLYQKLGLKNGDILKGLNGQSLADPTQALKLFEQLKELRSINLSLERNRETRDFKYEIR